MWAAVNLGMGLVVSRASQREDLRERERERERENFRLNVAVGRKTIIRQVDRLAPDKDETSSKVTLGPREAVTTTAIQFGEDEASVNTQCVKEEVV